MIGWTIFFCAIFLFLLVLALCKVSGESIDADLSLSREETTLHPQTFVPLSVKTSPQPFKANFSELEITIAAKTVWGEARGIESQMEQAAVVWCALNRYDRNGTSLADVLTAPNQFHYDESFQTVDDYGRDLTNLATDVIERWEREKNGETNVGRVLPAEYIYFGGDGTHNYFRDDYNFNGNIWDWSLPNPYEN